jgi:hypothetical protein
MRATKERTRLPNDLILQQPAQPTRLVLLFHGVGSSVQRCRSPASAIHHMPRDGKTVTPQLLAPATEAFAVSGISALTST